MAQNYYTYSNTFIDGQTARATEVAAEFQALEVALDSFYDDANTPAVVAAEAAQAAAELAAADAADQVVLAGDQVALAAGHVASAQASADAAEASAGLNNYQGSYSSGTTYPLGVSVTYNNRFFLSLQAANTGNQPDISVTHWQSITPIADGEVLSISSDTVLSASSKQFVKISSSVSYVKVTITNQSDGGFSQKVISNSGSQTFYVANDAGSIISAVRPSDVFVFSLINGAWQGSPLPALQVTQGEETIWASSGANYISIVSLTETKFIVAYSNVASGGTGYAVAGEVTDGQITYGTPVQFDGSAIGNTSITRLSDTSAVICWMRSNGYGVVATLTGTAISYGTVTLVSASIDSDITCSTTAANRVLVAGRRVSNSGIQLVDMTISGTTLAVSVTHTHASNKDKPSLAKVSTGGYVMAYRDVGLSSKTYMVTLGDAGNVTGTPVEAQPNSSTISVNVVMLTSTRGVVAYTYSSPSRAQLATFTLSGTTITLDERGISLPPEAGTTYANNMIVYSLVALSETSVAAAYINDGTKGNYISTVTIDDSNLILRDTVNCVSIRYTLPSLNGVTKLNNNMLAAAYMFPYSGVYQGRTKILTIGGVQ